MTTITADVSPLPCGPYLQALFIKAAESLDHSQIPVWDEEGLRNLQGLQQGRWQPCWTGRRGRHLSRIDVMACAALANLAAAASGPAWANTETADAQRLADAIREGRCAVW